MRITRQILGLAAASLFGSAPQLLAQQIDFSGVAIGCFAVGGACVPGPAFLGGDFTFSTGGGTGFAHYGVDTFKGTTSGVLGDNTASFGGGCASPGGNCGGFGNVFVTNGATFFTPAPGLELVVGFFFAPACPGCVPTVTPLPVVAAATAKGSILADGTGGFKIRFSDFTSNIPFTFSSGGSAGTCTVPVLVCVAGPYNGTGFIHLNDISIGNGQTIALNGDITVAVATGVPEPATLALFATGLVGLVPVARYRRRKSA